MTSLPEGIEDGEVIKKITGKITKLYDAEEQNGQFGTYMRQKGEIEIGGKTLHLYITSNEQPKSARGRTVTLESIKDDKTKAFKGVQYVIEKFTPKKGVNAGKEVTQEVIKVNGSAVVTYEGATPAGDAPAAKTNSAPNRQATGVAQSTSVVYPEPQSLQDLLNQIAYQHALTDATVRNAYKDDKYDEETLRAYVASVWIEVNRQGANRFYIFEKEVEKAKTQEPAKEEQEQAAEEDIPWTDGKEEATPEPESNPFGDWASVEVPDGKNKGTMLAKVGKVWIQKAFDAYKGSPKGFDTDFKKFVRQAAIDLGIAKDEEEDDSIPM